MSKNECQASAALLSPNPGKNLREGSGGRCLDGSWGQVPLGCSIQSGGDGGARFKISGDTGKECIHQMYQLVCSIEGKAH